MSHSTIGYILVGAVFFGGAQGLGVITRPDPGIEIHSLRYSESSGVPVVVQDRTVTAQGQLIAQWNAKVYRVEDAERKEACAGGGFWPYTEGRRQAPIPFNEWVGHSGCYETLPFGAQFTLCATYAWGDGGLEDYCEPEIFTKRQED